MPWGAFQGRAPQITACVPQTRIVPPERRLFPKESIKHGATRVQFEAWDSQNTDCYPRICEQELFFPDFALNIPFCCGFTPEIVDIRVFFEIKTFLFLFFV